MLIADIQHFCMHDGPGLRTTVFLKGCPLRCKWCHNPETQSAKNELLYYAKKCVSCGICASCGQKAHGFAAAHAFDRRKCVACGECADNCPTNALELCGKEMPVEALLSEIVKDGAFYGETGGVTVSGGEPLMQAEEVASLFARCKQQGISTALESCGYGDFEKIRLLIPFCDLFLWDVKDTDPVRHKQNTGVSNEKILENLFSADGLGAKTRLRCILINGINTEEPHYRRLAEIAKQLKHCQGVEFLPYHGFGSAKAIAAGKDSFENESWIPTKEQLLAAKATLEESGIYVFN